MKKERMTVEELRELLKENPQGVGIECDDGHYASNFKKVTVLSIGKLRAFVIDGHNSEETFCLSDLKHYPSQRESKAVTLYEIAWEGQLHLVNKKGHMPFNGEWSENLYIEGEYFQGFTGRICDFDTEKWQIVEGSFRNKEDE